MKLVGKFIMIKKDKSASDNRGFIVNDNSKRYLKAEVIDVGTEVEYCSKGDTIHYDKTQGHDIEYNNVQYRIILERDVVIVD